MTTRHSALVRKSAILSLLTILLALILAASPLMAQHVVQPPQEGSGAPAPTNQVVTGPRIWLQDNHPLNVRHVGDPAAAAALRSGQGQPLALAKGDFNADGIEDLVVGYATAGGGALALHRGNLDAFAPQSDATLFAIGRGEFPSPFLADAAVLPLPVRPDFVAVGSYNGEGFPDIIVAQRGSNSIYLLGNDGKGNFSAPKQINVGGPITGLAAGNLGHAGVFSTLLVGISDQNGSYLMVYQGTLNGLGGVTVLRVGAPVSNILFGDFGDRGEDAAFLAGDQIQVLRNSTLQLSAVSLPISVSAFAVGSFIPDRNPGPQLAALGSDGNTYIVGHSEFNASLPTAEQLNAIRNAVPRGRPNPLMPVKQFPANGWKIVETIVSATPFPQGQTPVFFTARISDHGADDVVVLNSFTGRMVVLSHPDVAPGAQNFIPAEVSSRPYAGSPVAALPMRINIDGRPGIMALHQGQVAPATLMPVPDPTFFVNRFDDPVPGAVASTCNNTSNGDTSTSCSLREAVRKANATAGTDTIQLVSGTYTLTQARVSNDFTAAHGTLDVTDSVNIVGATDGSGNPASIIQACDPTPNPTCSTGVDKVFSFNQDISAFTNATVSISNLVIRFGHNRGAFGGLQDGFGGGFDYDTGGTVAGTGNANLTVTNCTITNNATTDGDGGGVAVFNTNSGTGFAHFVSSTIQNNSPVRSTSGAAGGGIFVGSPGRIVLDSTQILNNTATQTSPATGSGGGIFTFGQPDPSVSSAIHASTISGNQAAGDGGGLDLDAATTIDTGTVISGNQAGTAGGGATNGGNGGGILFSAQTGDTLTISKVTISGNSAKGGAGATPGGGGIWLGANKQTVTMSFSRLAGNTAPNGSNLDIPVVGASSTLTMTDNWWGTNSPSGTITQGTANSVTFDPFIVLTHAASPAAIDLGETTTLTADFLHDNHGTSIAVSNLDVLLGLPLTFNNAIDGTLSNGGTKIQPATHTSTISTATEASSTVTITTSAAHQLSPGDSVIISGVAVSGYNGAFIVATTPTTTTFTYTDATTGLASSSGGTASVTAGTANATFTGTIGATPPLTGHADATVDSGTATANISITAIPPAATKLFGATSVPLSGTTTLTFSIPNENAHAALTGVAFTDNLPSGLVVATPPNETDSNCGGTVTATANATSVTLAGGTIPIAATCTISLNVTGATAGTKNNSVQATSTNAGTGASSNAILTVVAPPTIAKAFSPTSIALNGTSTVTFTITNPNTTAPGDLTGIAFSDTLPVSGGSGSATLVVASTPNVSNTCNGTVTANANSGSISLSGGSLAHNGSGNATCTLSVDVKGTVAGDANNTTGAITSTNGGTGTTSNTATLKVVAPPTISKAFGATSIPLNGTTTVTFTITNPGSNTSAETGIAFSDTLTGGLQVASTPGVTNSCNGTVTAAANTTTISLSGGSIATPGNTCTIVVNVTGTTAGNNIPNTTGAVSSTNGGTGATSNTANLTVVKPADVTKQFGAPKIPLNGTTSLTINIANNNSAATLSGLSFTDTLPGGLMVASTPALSNTCSGTATAAANSGTVSLSGGTLPAGASCAVSVNVTGTSAGDQNNSVTVSSTEGGTSTAATATVTVVAPPTIAKGFGASSIALSGTTTVTFTIHNPNNPSTPTNGDLTGVAFSDTLPVSGGAGTATLTVAATPGVSNTCNGTVTATANSGSISLSGGTVAHNSSCTISVNVTGTVAGDANNTTGAISSTEGGTGVASNTAQLKVVAPPTISKAFGATNISLNGTTTVTFTITNPAANTSAENGIAFSDTLTGGLQVASTPGVTNSCNGTVTAAANTTSISLSGGSITTPGTTCTIVVNVTGTQSGTVMNTTGAVSSTNGGTGNTSNTAQLVVASPATVSKQFGAPKIPLNGTTTLTINITNPNTNVTLNGLSFTDTLPGGLQVAATPALSNTCNGTATAVANSGTVSLSGGSVASSASCVVSVNVTGTIAGDQNNSVTVSSTEGGTSTAATATVTVVAPPTIAKAFGASSIALSGTTTVTFTIHNPNNPSTPTNGDLTGVAFSDTLPVSGGAGTATLTVAATPGVSNTCNGTVTANANSGSISLSGGTVAHNSSCTISVNVTGTVAGDANNTTGAISSTEGGTGVASNTAQLKVVAPPTISKAFGATNISLNGTTTVTFTITNPAANTSAENGIAFSDTLTGGLQVASTPGVTNTCNGTVTAAANTTSISLSGGSITTPGTTCTIVVNVTGTQSGTVMNTTGAVSSTNGGTGNTSNTAQLIVASPPTISKAFGASSIALNATTSLTFTINNPNSNVALSGVAFSDTLPSGLVVATPNNLSNTCNGSVTATAGSGSVSLSGGSIAQGGSCTLSVNVQGTSAGTKQNTTGAVSSTEGGTGSASNTAQLIVNQASTSTAVASSANPSVFGQSVTFTATVTNTSAGSTGSPTGTVQFVVDGVNFGSPVALAAATSTTSTATSGAIATLSVTGSPHTITANFSNSDGNFTNSSGSLSGGQNVTVASTSTAVASSDNPSVFGESVNFTATVTDTSAGSTAQPTGSVQFVVDGVNFGSPVTLSGATSTTSTAMSQATATLSISGSPHTVTALYSNSDGNFSNSSNSLAGGQVVTKANTTTTVVPSQGTITLGDTVTFTATVTANPPGSGTPTGLVTFFDGSTPLGFAGLNGSGQATFSTAVLSVGSHSITAKYLGDANFAVSPTSSPITETVNLRSSATAVALNPTTVGAGQASTVTVTVTDSGTLPPGTPDVFTTTGAPATGRTGFTSTVYSDNLVLVAGGTDASNNVLNSAEVYNVSGGGFSASGNLNHARTGAVAVLLSNGRILIAGGSSNGTASGALNSAELFDAQAGTFANSSHNLTAARFGATATLLTTGKVLIAGGSNGGGTLNSAEIYDPATDTFTATGNLNAARTGASATLLGTGKVLVAGGSSNGTAAGALSSAEVFDPAGNGGAGTFAPVAGAHPNLSTGRWQPESANMAFAKVMLAGGQNSGGVLTSADIYDPVADSFTAAAHPMNEGRSGGTAISLPSGMVLLAGGTTSEGAELYDPEGDRFNPTGTLLHFNEGLISTLLNNGRVLVVGLPSNLENNPPPSDAELYTPTFNPLGTVGLNSSEPTDVFGPACVLTPSTSTASTCTSTVTPEQVATSPHTITGTYPADTVHSGSSNSASLTVIPTAPPTISKAFAVQNVAQNSTVNVAFTINNPNPAATLTGISFTDNLPAGMVVATPNNLTNTCGGTVTAVAGSSSITLSGGVLGPPAPPPQVVKRPATPIKNTNAASGSCVITLDVLVTGTGTLSNATGPISANESGPGNPSNTATVNVILPPTVNKNFGAASIPLNGTTSLTFNIANPNTSAPGSSGSLVNISLSDTLPSGLVVATPNGLTGSCVASSTISATAGSGSISLSNLTLSMGGSCSFSVNVTGTTAGTKNNVSGNITGTFDDGTGLFRVATGGTASASIFVVAPPSIAKAFAPAAIAPGGVSTLTFTITNPAANTVAETGVAFNDTLPTNVVVATPNGLSGSCGGSVTATAGSGGISLSGGSIAVSSQCVFSVNVTSSVIGNYTNTTGAVSSTNGGTGNTASANLTVAHANLSITKTHTGNFSRGQTGAQYTITVSNASGLVGPTVGTVTVTDTLPNVQNTLVPTAMSGTGWTCNLGTLTCTRSDALNPGASYPAITLTVNVPQNIQANVTNSATVSGGGDPNSHTANDLTHVGPPIQVNGPNSVQANDGGQGSMDFTVDSTNGLGTLNFSCSGLPFGANCSFNPPSSNQLSTTVTMTVSTTMGSALTPPAGPWQKIVPVFATLLLPVGGLVQLRGGKRRRRLLGLLLLGLILLVMIGLPACGGHGGGIQGTPRGSFAITVTATSPSTGQTGSANVTLNVI